MESLRREYTSDVRQIGEMRDFVRDSCRRAWGDNAENEEGLGLLILALDEAAANIILHAYEKQAGQPIEMIVEIDAAEVGVSLHHRGRDFDPTTARPPDFDGSRECGFGLYLIQQSVDEVRYFHDEQGRCAIRLVKKRRQSPEKGA